MRLIFFTMFSQNKNGKPQNTKDHIYAAAVKSLQLCPTVRPHRRQPTRLPRPWDSPGKNTGVGCHFLLQCMKIKRESEVAQSYPTLSDPMDCSLPGSSVHGFSRQECWSGVPLPSPPHIWRCGISQIIVLKYLKTFKNTQIQSWRPEHWKKGKKKNWKKNWNLRKIVAKKCESRARMAIINKY